MLRHVQVLLFILVCASSLTSAAMNVGHGSQDSFAQCLVTKPPGSLGTCIGISALRKLQTLDNDPEFDLVDGVTLTRDEHQPRDAYNYVDRDPSDFRNIVESLGNLMYKRILRWDMSMVYPGLSMRVSPSINPGGVLEFVLDPQHEVHEAHSLKEASTGKLLARQFLLPFLLGFKFNVATLVPIMFGILAILAKKAVFVSKIALIVSSALGLGTLLLGTGGYGGGGGGGYGYGHGHGPYGYGYGVRPHRYNEDEQQPLYNEAFFRGESTNHVVNFADDGRGQDQLRIFGDATLQQVFPREEKGRNFKWVDSEKAAKVH